MTITLKPWMTILLIATICVLSGFAVGQITQANSAKNANIAASQVRDRAVINQLKTLNRRIGKPGIWGQESLLAGTSQTVRELKRTARNTYWMCLEMTEQDYSVTCEKP